MVFLALYSTKIINNIIATPKPRTNPPPNDAPSKLLPVSGLGVGPGLVVMVTRLTVKGVTEDAAGLEPFIVDAGGIKLEAFIVDADGIKLEAFIVEAGGITDVLDPFIVEAGGMPEDVETENMNLDNSIAPFIPKKRESVEISTCLNSFQNGKF